MNEEKDKIKKVSIIVSKGDLPSVYAGLVLANGGVMEGITANMFFTFFGLEAITKKHMDNIGVATVGNPAMHIPTWVGAIPGMAEFAEWKMKKEMEKLDLPTVPEFLDMIKAGGGKIFACKLAADMFHVKPDDLWEGVEDTITVGQFYEHAAGDDSQIVFI